MKETRKELFNACRLYKNGNYKEALEIFDKHYKTCPELFHIRFRSTYAWTIYRLYIDNFKSEEILFKAAEKITDITTQQDLNTEDICIYTVAVMKVIRYLKKQEGYYSLSYWLEKLDPMLLADRHEEYNGRTKQSDREFYFETASIAYYKSGDYENCIEVTKKALSSLSSFVATSEVWHKWRLAKSLNMTGHPTEALDYLLEIIEIKGEWFMYNEIAEIYYNFKKPDRALDYLAPAVLSSEPLQNKAKIYYLIYRILSQRKSELALMHGELYYLLKKEKGHELPADIKVLGLNEAELDKREILKKIRDVWTQYRFKDQKLRHGTVIKFINEKNYGFIRDENDESIFFHKDEFVGCNVYVGQMVSFYTEESFDKAKMKKSVKAVNVRGE